MRCTVLLFAQARELAGCDQLALDLPDGATVAEALDAICLTQPRLQALRGRIAVAINERYEQLDATLPADCTLAIIPPVSGG